MLRTIKEVAKEFNVSGASISAKLKRKGVKKVSGKYLIDDDLYQWLIERKDQVGRPKKNKEDN